MQTGSQMAADTLHWPHGRPAGGSRRWFRFRRCRRGRPGVRRGVRRGGGPPQDGGVRAGVEASAEAHRRPRRRPRRHPAAAQVTRHRRGRRGLPAAPPPPRGSPWGAAGRGGAGREGALPEPAMRGPGRPRGEPAPLRPALRRGRRVPVGSGSRAIPRQGPRVFSLLEGPRSVPGCWAARAGCPGVRPQSVVLLAQPCLCGSCTQCVCVHHRALCSGSPQAGSGFLEQYKSESHASAEIPWSKARELLHQPYWLCFFSFASNCTSHLLFGSGLSLLTYAQLWMPSSPSGV